MDIVADSCLLQRGVQVLHCRIDRDVCAELSGKAESVLAQVGHDDLRSARRLDQHHDQKADRAGTRDKDVIVLNWLCQPDGVMRHGEGLQKGTFLVRNTVR